MTIISKRHPVKFYFSLFFGSIFLFGLGTLLLFVGIDTLQKENPTTKEYFMPVFSIAIYLFAIKMLYTYCKNSPQIILNKHSIKIGKEKFYLADIKDIKLTGKMPFKLFINFPKEGTSLQLNNGTEKILFDDMYSNISEIKLFLEQVVLKKQDFIPNSSIKINKEVLRFENEEIFKGNQFTSMRGISLWSLIVFFTFLLFDKSKNLPAGFSIFFFTYGSFWFILHSWFMHYFGMTKDYLIVRNHNFVWKAKIYRLTEIKEVVFETQFKQPNCMRIITTDFKNNLYPAGTLRNKTWLEIKSRLESKGLIVRNECIYE